jgi:hypothetical protein
MEDINFKEPQTRKIKRKLSDITQMRPYQNGIDMRISQSIETFSRIYDAIRILYQDGEYEIISLNSLICTFPQFLDKKLYIYVNEKNQLYINWEETKMYTLVDSSTGETLLSTRKKVQSCIDIVRKIQWKHFCVSLVDTMNQIYINHQISHMFINQSEYFCYLFIADRSDLKRCLLCIKIHKNYQLWDTPLPSEVNEDIKPIFISDHMKKAYTTFFYDLGEYLYSKKIIAPIKDDSFEDCENQKPQPYFNE